MSTTGVQEFRRSSAPLQYVMISSGRRSAPLIHNMVSYESTTSMESRCYKVSEHFQWQNSPIVLQCNFCTLQCNFCTLKSLHTRIDYLITRSDHCSAISHVPHHNTTLVVVRTEMKCYENNVFDMLWNTIALLNYWFYCIHNKKNVKIRSRS